jgi:hypothetical protein
VPNIIFTKGGVSFTFSKGRVFPLNDPGQVNVAVDYSAGGQLYAYDKGIEEQFYNLVMERVPKADFDNFAAWLLDVAVGPLNTFTYTDEDGVAHTVRLLDTKNPFKEVAHELYSGTIHLRKEI